MSRKSRSGLDLRVQRALPRSVACHAPLAKVLRHWAAAALQGGRAELCVRLVGEPEGLALNRDYRGKDYATNVLTFVYEPDEAFAGLSEIDTLRGDLVLCVPVVVREACEQGKDVEAHFAHLVVHGMLHLQGYEHESEAKAVIMESREREIMIALGFSDPYANVQV